MKLGIFKKNKEQKKDISGGSKRKGIFAKFKEKLFKKQNYNSEKNNLILDKKEFINSNLIEKLEEILIFSDISVSTTEILLSKIFSKRYEILNFKDLKSVLFNEIVKNFDIDIIEHPSNVMPLVTMVVGVNGVGKTTSIAKLANLEIKKGNKCLLVAADTFRAASLEQITVLSKRIGSDLVKHRPNADPASVAYDGVNAGIFRKVQNVYIDTSGRLHTKVNLMKELKKIVNSIDKCYSGAPHEILLVLDATTGQNAVNQAKKFREILNITGIIMAKLDGSSKGGVLIDVCRKTKVPIKYVGLGENLDDFEKFNLKKFINRLL